MTPSVRYPTGVLTPHGAYHVLAGKIPMMAYRSYDDTSVFHLMGGAAIPDPTTPEAVRLVELKGLMPPWKPIEQKGATQDGTSFVTALYDPCDINMVVQVKGRDPQYARRVVRDWIAAWDAKQPGELSFFTPELGRWWAQVRWGQNPVDKIVGGNWTWQKFTWNARAHDAFWRSYDHVSQFAFSYASASDGFDTDHASDLGSDWTIAYSGAGTGTMFTDNSQAQSSLDSNKTAVCRHNSFTSTTDNQVVTIDLGRFPATWWFPTNAYVDVWARMANTGTAGEDGIRLRIGHRTLTLSAFDGGTETVLRQQTMLIPSMARARFSLVVGFDTNTRLYKVVKNNSTIMSVKDVGTSHLGSGYRKAGFGMAALGTTDTPTVWGWAAGDNNTVAQSGYIDMVNVGDQAGWPRYTCYGPGTFYIADGPGSNTFVQFGPLLENQVMQLRTDPGKRGVVDLTSIPPTQQELTFWQQAIADFISFATGNNVPPLLQEIESIFGIRPPQGNPYSLLSGRFSKPVPAKPAGTAASTHHIAVSIDDGTADSKITAAMTPLRRFPW